jgi:P27 family predicted phage terminase small subunit
MKDTNYLGISSEAKIIFDSIAEKYADKVDVELDFATLAIYAQSCVKLTKLNKAFGDEDLFYKTDKGTWTAHPVRDEMSMLQKQIHYTSAKLGLTPDARHKIKMELAEMEHRKSNSKSGRKPNHKKTIDEQIEDDTEEFL